MLSPWRGFFSRLLARLKRAGVAVEYRTARTKPEIALAEIDRVIATGVRFACVLADAGYGLSAPFRHGLTARNLAWAVGIPRHLKVYPVDVRLLWPVARRGRPRRRHVPDILSMPAASAPPMGHRSGSGIRVSNICPAMKPGLSANTAAQAKRNTISPICLQRPVCVPWRPPSRHDGFASKPISS